jgi:5'-methylthioadenosine phosphorylase
MSGNVAIIGGTGFESLPPEIFSEEVVVETQHGVARALSISNNYIEPAKLYFVSRHGASHGLAPHQINYKANTDLLLALGVKYVLATNAVGSLSLEHAPGKLVLFSDFIDMTRSRDRTYFTGTDWKHVDFTEPYSGVLRGAVLRAAAEYRMEIAPTGTYLCVDGPRFETPAEVRLFGSWGADVVGMTGIPEAVMAKEVGIEYAALGIVTNPGAGLSNESVSHDQVVDVMASSITNVRELLLRACSYISR